jgi:Carboxypeptidase regulatory-like domain
LYDVSARGAKVDRCGRGRRAARAFARVRPSADPAHRRALRLAAVGRPVGVAGRVTYVSAPVAGAVVRLWASVDGVEVTLAENLSDGLGRFAFEPVPPTELHVSAELPEHSGADEIVDLRAPDGRPEELELVLWPCLLRVHGTVRDVGGGALARARVRAASLDPFHFATEVSRHSALMYGVRGGRERTTSTVADDAGRYALCTAPGWLRLEADADRHGPTVTYAGARADLAIDLSLPPETAIAGRVVGPDGAPVAGALIVARAQNRQPGVATMSDAAGQFRFGNLAPVRYLIVARAGDGAADAVVGPFAPGKSGDVVLSLARGLSVRGRAIADGRPLAGARVRVVGADPGAPELGSAVTQADGRFVLSGLPRGGERVEVEGYRTVDPQRAELGDFEGSGPRDRAIDIVCERRKHISGRVMRNGAPVARANVYVLSGSSRWVELTAMTDAHGGFSVDVDGPDRFQLYAESNELAALSASQLLEIGAAAVDGVVLELDGTATVAGTVVDGEGAPVAGASVRLSSLEGEEAGFDITAADGSFLVAAKVEGGPYIPMVAPVGGVDDYRHFREPGDWPKVIVPDRNSRVVTEPVVVRRGPLAISGRVTRAGVPVTDVSIRAWSKSAFGGARTGHDGSFVVPDLVAGTYTVGFYRPGRDYLKQESVAAGTSNLAVELPATGGIEGPLRGFTRAPSVIAVANRREWSDGWLDADVAADRFFIDEVPPGGYRLIAGAPDGGAAMAEVIVVAGQTTRLALTSWPRATVTGVVRRVPGGEPVPDAECRAPLPFDVTENLSWWERVDASGRYTLRVPAGKVRVECRHRSIPVPSSRDLVVAVAPGATAVADVETLVFDRSLKWPDSPVELDGENRVYRASAAAKAAGIAVGDLVVACDGIELSGFSRWAVTELLLHGAGSEARITIRRGGVVREVVVRLPALMPSRR